MNGFVQNDKPKEKKNSVGSKKSGGKDKLDHAESVLTGSGVSGIVMVNKKELQQLKYIIEGGNIIKKNLFESWVTLYEQEVSFLTQADGAPKVKAPIDPTNRLWNVAFDHKQEEIYYQKMSEYMVLRPPTSHQPTEKIYSMVHLKRGIFLSAGSDNKLKVWLPGRSMRPNYLG